MQHEMTSADTRIVADSARDRRNRRNAYWALGLLAVVLLCLSFNWLRWELLGYSVLVHVVDPSSAGAVARWQARDVRAEDVAMAISAGAVPARLYIPKGVAHPPGIVVVHGIHHLGIEDPRFVNFARALAGGGFAVLTPVVSALADYHVDAESIPTIGESAAWLEQRLGTGPVSVITLSFSGGLALLAACDARYAPHWRALVVFGGYDDLARVSRFLATNEEVLPDGRKVEFTAHDYGASVFVYAHLAQFFSSADIPAAHEALRQWLWERPEEAKPWLDKLSPDGRAVVDCLMARRVQDLRPKVLETIHADEADLAALSPHGRLANLHVPVFIVHGSEDNVIPYPESLWLAKDVPAAELRGFLITPAFTHVDPRARASWKDQLRLVDFMARILHTASN